MLTTRNYIMYDINITACGGNISIIYDNLKLLPDFVLETLYKTGVKICVVNDSVIEYDPELSEVRPRGWPSGSTWDIVPGIFLSDSNTVVIATSEKYETGCNNFVLHEIGHAYDKSINYASYYDTFFKEAYDMELSKLDSYLKQPGGAGKCEAFADSFENYFSLNRKYYKSHRNFIRYWDNHVLTNWV